MKKLIPSLGSAACLLLASHVSLAADHIDAPSVVADPAADVTDLFAWMTPDANSLNLIMDSVPFAGSDAKFSNAVQYVFHVNSSEAYGQPQTETLVLCQFDEAQTIECWAGDEYVTGDASSTSGIQSESGRLKVFAGLRNDPFFMEFTGFAETVKAVIAAAPSLIPDMQGCPALDADTSNALVGQLQSGMNGAPASDTFAGTNVLALVIQLDKTVVNTNGPILSVWASTNTAN